MALRSTLIAACWGVFVLTWIVTAVVYRPPTPDSAGPRPRPRRLRAFRLLLAIVLLLAIRSQHVGTRTFGHVLGWVGVLMCATGIGIAIWARLCLGRNWGMPMSLRAQPTLVRSGPYAVVRHPIYSGLLLAMVGSALTTGLGWIAALVATAAYFVISAGVEERDMRARFPDEYPAYAGHTKRLIPYVY